MPDRCRWNRPLLILTAGVRRWQKLLLTNRLTEAEQECEVVRGRAAQTAGGGRRPVV
jgi:hypothetical protein